MQDAVVIGIIGEYDSSRESHVATQYALERAGRALQLPIVVRWVSSKPLEDSAATVLAEYDGVWCAPGSMYESFLGALEGIRFAREKKVPFLGTCAGFQHAVIEYARNVMGIANAAHQEVEPEAENPFIQPFSCSLRGKTMNVRAKKGSKVLAYYGTEHFEEQYYCSMGLSHDNQIRVDAAGFRVVGVDADDEARIVELPGHPFFIATLFVPQRNLSKEQTHPLILAFVRAAAAFHQRRASTVAV